MEYKVFRGISFSRRIYIGRSIPFQCHSLFGPGQDDCMPLVAAVGQLQELLAPLGAWAAAADRPVNCLGFWELRR